MKDDIKKRTAIASFESGRGNTMEIIFPRVISKIKPNFSVNNKGVVTFLEKNNNTKDKLVLLNKESTFIEFKKGLLDNIERNKVYDKIKKKNQKTQIIDVSIGDKEENKLIFEFLADNCTSEFSYQIYENGNKYICTTFLDNCELSATQLINRNGKLAVHIHSHPMESTLQPSSGDLGSASKLHKYKFNTKFLLYSPITKEYKDYDKDSSWEFEEVIIKAKKRTKK